MSLDYAVAERQTFATTFRAETVEGLLDGRLTMPPHPSWQLPQVIDWAANPFDDVNWQAQFHMLRWIEPLRRAAVKGDERALAMWLRWARDWVQHNPREASAHKWVWSDMVDGIRAIQFCLAAPLLRDKSPDDLAWLEHTIRDHAEHMADPENLGHSNHAMHQHEALFVCGRILGDDEYTELAVRRFDELLGEEYDEQGVNAEGAIAYHYNNYLWYERALKRFDVEGVPRPAAAARHALAPEEIAHATRPDGTFVTIGDTDEGTPRAIGTPFTDYITSAGASGEPPADLVKIYDSGYVFARSGWGETERALEEETFFSVSFGEADRVHGHPDGGSLTFSSEAVNWVVDPGKFQYGGSIPRRHFLSRAAHSLVVIEGRTPRKDAVVSLTRREITDTHVDLLFSDNSFDGVDLTRRVIYSTNGDYLVIVDHARANEDCTGIQRWQLGADVTTALKKQHVVLGSGDHRASLSFHGTTTTLEEVRGRSKPFDGWVATGWKQKAEAPAILARKSGKNFRFITVLAAGKGAVPTAKTVPADKRGRFCLQVDTGKVTEFILVGHDFVRFPTTAPSEGDGAGVADAAPPVAVVAASSGGPHHLDPESRSAVFDALAAARADAWGSSGARRGDLAEELRAQKHGRGLTGSVDLGLTAGITDLQGTKRGRANPQLVEPHRTALLNFSGEPDWRPTFYAMPVHSHRSPAGLSQRLGKPAIHTLLEGPLLLPVAVDPRRGDTLTVLFQGAVDRAKVRIPIFQRWRHQLDMAVGPTMAIADPTLDLSTAMRLGWYLGTESIDLPARIAAAVTAVAQSLKVRNVVLVGSSGGGFAALQVGAHLPEAVVVAMSPQTDLRRYSPRLTNAAIEPAFGLPEVPRTGELTQRIDVAARLDACGTYPRVQLISNLGDAYHVKNHEIPLREHFAAAGHATALTTVEVDLGRGHRSVDNDTYTKLLDDVYSTLP